MKMSAKTMGKKIFNYVKANKLDMLKLCVMAGVVVYTGGDATCFAQNDVKGLQGASNLGTLDTGLGDKMNEAFGNLNSAFTGTIPKVGVSIAAAGAFLNYAIGNENQVTKMATRVAVGGGAAMAAPSLIGTVAGCCI